MTLRRFLGAAVLFLLGFLTGSGFDLATAQEQIGSKEQAWEIYHGSAGKDSFYVVKHNRLTGETLVLSAEGGAGDDSWLLLPVEDRRTRK